MIDLKKIQSLIQRTPEEKDYPKHVIINLHPLKHQESNYSKLLDLITDIVELQTNSNIPIMTISLGNDIKYETELRHYLRKLQKVAIEKKIKVTMFGRWYDLEGELVEAIKKINYETDDFDHFFLNICINYNGQQEIADACRVIIRKILENKTDVDAIDIDLIKENIYSSYFIPPELIIESGQRFSGTFLWDSMNAEIINLNKQVLDFTKSDISKSIELFAAKSAN